MTLIGWWASDTDTTVSTETGDTDVTSKRRKGVVTGGVVRKQRSCTVSVKTNSNGVALACSRACDRQTWVVRGVLTVASYKYICMRASMQEQQR